MNHPEPAVSTHTAAELACSTLSFRCTLLFQLHRGRRRRRTQSYAGVAGVSLEEDWGLAGCSALRRRRRCSKEGE